MSPSVVKAYCLKCRDEVVIKEPREVKMKNGNTGIAGLCCRCGVKVFTICRK